MNGLKRRQTPMQKKRQMTPLKSIRLKCLDCCSGSIIEVRHCPADDCSLHLYRFGKNPARAGVGGNPNFQSQTGKPYSSSDLETSIERME